MSSFVRPGDSIVLCNAPVTKMHSEALWPEKSKVNVPCNNHVRSKVLWANAAKIFVLQTYSPIKKLGK